MISFKEAKKIAKKILPRCDVYQEYSTAYLFWEEHPNENRMWDNEVVVLKETGEVVSHGKFVIQYKKGNTKPPVKQL